MLLIGDFNLPGFVWYRENDLQFVRGFSQFKVLRTLVDRLIDLANSFNLHQCDSLANSYGNFLDLCFSNVSVTECYSTIDLLFKLDYSHPALIIIIDKFCYNDLDYKYKVLNFKKADYVSLNVDLGRVDWSDLFEDADSLDSMLDRFYDVIYENIACHVPTFYYSNSDSPPWFNKELTDAIHLKLYYHSQ